MNTLARNGHDRSLTDHRAGPQWYQTLVRPDRIAVIGASADHRKGSPLRHLRRLGYPGAIYPINPRGGTIDGLPVYAHVRECPEVPDMALILVPARGVPDAVEACGQAGVAVVYVLSAGFAELGPDGTEFERAAANSARRHGMRMLGPNSNGMISVRSSTVASIMTTTEDLELPLRDDKIGLISQSGAVGSFILTDCLAAGIGIGTYFSTGNGADVSFEDLFDEMVKDDGVEVILAYIEGLADGRQFARAAHRARAAGKPVVVLKVGVTNAGAAASASHTASLAGSDRVYSGVLEQAGVHRASSLRGLVDAARLLTAARPRHGRRVGFITISGGLAVMAADTADAVELSLPDWTDTTVASLRGVLPDYVSVRNPLDTSGAMADDHEMLKAVIQLASADTSTDSLVLALGGSDDRRRRVMTGISEILPQLAKPISIVWAGGRWTASDGRVEGAPTFDSVEEALTALAVVSESMWPMRAVLAPDPEIPPDVLAIIGDARARGNNSLDEHESKHILRAFGVACVRESSAATADEALRAVEGFDRPVVAKVQSVKLLHKSDVGGVRLGLVSDRDVVAATVDLLELGRSLGDPDTRVVLQEQVVVGTQLIIGSSTDPTFGTVVTIGFGGVEAEVDADAWTGLPPIDRGELLPILNRLRRRRLLAGFRGSAPVDLTSLAEAVTAFAGLADTLGDEIQEFDVNPLIVERTTGVVTAVDAAVILRHRRTT